MLQRVHQYIAIEALVAGKRDQSKQSRAKQPRGHPSGPPKRREDRSDMLSSRPPPIPLNSTRTEIFLQIQERGLMKTLNLMKTRSERHDKRRYCRHLRRYVRDQSSFPDGRSPRDQSPRPKGPVEKQIDIIIGGWAARKAYARTEVGQEMSMQVLRSGENNASKKSSNRSASRPTEGDASGNEWLALLDRNETSKLFWG
ncbi:hypothetical protein BHE74_00000243 [Ensete ventricosum]|nr:hypothetical protein BHE74_00000243 [Ensete ventricosum]